MRNAKTGTYRGRIAPTPTGLLHAGHGVTFLTAALRAEAKNGTLVFRMEDLDPHRCKEEYRVAALEDLRGIGISWQEGPDVGGPFQPYEQSKRTEWYLRAWRKLRAAGRIYPCRRSRKDLASITLAPHHEEPVFPPEWRAAPGEESAFPEPDGVNWRFRVPDGRRIRFKDERLGEFSAVAGADFGDFPVWRRDGVPAYELAVVVDDIAMEITEVVRGEDLMLSTCRQLLLYEALEATPPVFFHCPLVRDATGRRLAKRDRDLSLRVLLERGISPEVFSSQQPQ